MFSRILILSVILLCPGLANAQFTYYIPHVINGFQPDRDSYSTQFSVMNPSASTQVTLTISLFNHDGSPLPAFADTSDNTYSSWTFPLKPRSGTLFSTASRPGNGGAGWARIDSTGALNASAILQDTSPFDSVLRAIVTVPATQFVTQFSAQAYVNSLGGSVGMALLNPQAGSASITIQLFSDLDPVNPVAAQTITLLPQNNVADFLGGVQYLNNLLPTTSTGPVFHGVMQVTSSVPIAPALIFVESNTFGWTNWPIFVTSN